MITYKELENRKFNTKFISNKPINGHCIKCGVYFEYSHVKKFLKTRSNKLNKKYLWQSCQKCWHYINTGEDQEWVKNNSKIQKTIQNTPEQLQKNRIGVRNSWTKQRRKRASQLLKKRWKNNKIFKEKALNNLSHDDNQAKIGFGCGGLKGKYKNIKYDSALELSFILWCEYKKILIKRYNYDPIQYLDENGLLRKYYPDFIINENDIVEIKGAGLWYRKNYERNIKKIEAAKKIYSSYIIIFETDESLKTFYKLARKIHNETYKKNYN